MLGRGIIVTMAAATLLCGACSGGDASPSGGPTSVSGSAPSTSSPPTASAPAVDSAADVPGVTAVGSFRGSPEVVVEAGSTGRQRLRQVQGLLGVPPAQRFWVRVDGGSSRLLMVDPDERAYDAEVLALVLVAADRGDATVPVILRPATFRVDEDVAYEYDDLRVSSPRPVTAWAVSWVERATQAMEDVDAATPHVMSADVMDFHVTGADGPSLEVQCEGAAAQDVGRALRWVRRTRVDVREVELEGTPYSESTRCPVDGLTVWLPPGESVDDLWADLATFPGPRVETDIRMPRAVVAAGLFKKPSQRVEIARELAAQGYRVSFTSAPRLQVEAPSLADLLDLPSRLAPHHRVIREEELYEVSWRNLSIMGHEDSQPTTIPAIARLRGCGVEVAFIDDVTHHQELTLSEHPRTPSSAAACINRRLVRGAWPGFPRISVVWTHWKDGTVEFRVRRDGRARRVTLDASRPRGRAPLRRTVRSWNRAAR